MGSRNANSQKFREDEVEIITKTPDKENSGDVEEDCDEGKSKRCRGKVLSVVTSKEWTHYFIKKEVDKKKNEREKEERKKVGELNKLQRLKEKEGKQKLKQQIKKRKIDESSDSANSEISFAETFDEEETFSDIHNSEID
ncbi:hypothetical protein JTB14_016517 [Gonioctena quinquepunctata]|nr:hypothetical protein JTB14_016517 [Gonioctena quinquepunctata]